MTASSGAPSRGVLVVGDVITDTVVQLRQPIAIGTDAAAEIQDTSGGQGANVARWLRRAGVQSVHLLASVSLDTWPELLHIWRLSRGLQLGSSRWSASMDRNDRS
jgi:hypothetical protein